MLTLIALAVVAQAGDDPAAHGASLLAPFKAELKSALMAGMEEGPATAIEVCSQDAPGIAAKLSVDGVLMGRSSHKLRNPDNAAPEWLAPIIDVYASREGELEPVVVKLDDGRHGYAEPIRVQPLCLTCHGKVVHADVADRIEALYPDDEATGFSEGDFRGVFWVSF
jgi:hypothetical protein